MAKKTEDRSAYNMFNELLDSAGNPQLYGVIVSEIIKKYGSDRAFVQEVTKESGIPVPKVIEDIQRVADSPLQEDVEAQKNQEKELAKQAVQPAPATPPGIPAGTSEPNVQAESGVADTEPPAQQTPPPQLPQIQSQVPAAAKPQSAASPQGIMKGAAQNQAKGMSPGQALNMANQQPKPSMKKGGLIHKPQYMKDGGDFGEIDLQGLHRPGMLNGGLADLPDFNNSVEMEDGGELEEDIEVSPEETVGAELVQETINGLPETEVPAGALPEEVADDQPVMLSKGEFVFPANVVRYVGLETLMKLRDKALIGLNKMEEGGQIRRPGDDKNPGDLGEVEAEPVLQKGGILKAENDNDGFNTAVQDDPPKTSTDRRSRYMMGPDGPRYARNNDPRSANEGLERATKRLKENEKARVGEEEFKYRESVREQQKNKGGRSGGGSNSISNTKNHGLRLLTKDPDTLMKKGGIIPPDDTTRLPNTFPSATKNTSKLGAGLGKRSLRTVGKSDPMKNKAIFRKMAKGGLTEELMEEAGAYINSRDASGNEDKADHRDSLAGYENFGDWINAMGNTPNIFGPGMLSDAARGKGMFGNYNPDYMTTKELNEGKTHVGKALEVAESKPGMFSPPTYDDNAIAEDAKELMDSYGSNQAGTQSEGNAGAWGGTGEKE